MSRAAISTFAFAAAASPAAVGALIAAHAVLVLGAVLVVRAHDAAATVVLLVVLGGIVLAVLCWTAALDRRTAGSAPRPELFE